MKKKRIITIIAALTIIMSATVAAAACAKHVVNKKTEEVISMMQPVDKEEIETLENKNLNKKTLDSLKDNWTIALFGVDSRDKDDIANANSDVIMIATLDHDTGGIKLVSVYRDTCLKTGKNQYKKINSAYPAGGPKNAVKALNDNLDLNIDDYAAFSWKAVADGINILGGIDINITDAEFKYINAFITETVKSTGVPSTQLKEPGYQHLDGVQAVAYSRLRLMDNDFKRTERQRKVIELSLNKAKNSDLSTINKLISTVLPQVASSISTDDIYTVAQNIFRLHFNGTTGFPFTHYEKTVEGAAYVFPDNLTDNVSRLHEYLYGTENYEPSDEVEAISEKVKEKSKKQEQKETYHKKPRYETETVEKKTEPEPESEISYEPQMETDINSDNILIATGSNATENADFT